MFFPVSKERHAIFYVPPQKVGHQIVLLCCISPACAIARPKPYQCRQHFKFNLLEELLPLFILSGWLSTLPFILQLVKGKVQHLHLHLHSILSNFPMPNSVDFARFQKSASLRHPRHGAALPYPQNGLSFPTQRYPVFPPKNVGNRWREVSPSQGHHSIRSLLLGWMRE